MNQSPFVFITITAEAYNLVRANANNLDESRVKVLPDGRRRFRIDAETLERLALVAFPGESVSDTIVRAMAAMKGKPQ